MTRNIGKGWWLGLFLVLALAIEFARWAYHASLREVALLDGTILFCLVAFLAAASIGKTTLALFPLPRATFWHHAHVMVGWLSCVVFVMHAGTPSFSGWLPSILWLLFALVAVSGILGEVLSQFLPVRMRESPDDTLCQQDSFHLPGNQGAKERRRPERVPFERIPELRQRLVVLAEELIKNETSRPTLAAFAKEKLIIFLLRPPAIVPLLLRSDTTFLHLSNAIRHEERYLDERGQATLYKLKGLAQAKNNLDYQYAHHVAIKGWTFIHVPLASALLIMAGVHGLLIRAFFGGEP
ncbi:MAG: hypothetical protein H7840_13000 [Alphaproteobacteria bacterium]